MNSKAQIASLDFILSVVLVVVALGLVMQTIEVNQYTMKEMEIHNELERIGETAADILVSHPDFTCDLYNHSGNIEIGELQNCVEKKTTVTKRQLGIPTGYDYAERLAVFWLPGNSTTNPLTKTKIINCQTNNCPGNLAKRVLKIKVWRTP